MKINFTLWHTTKGGGSRSIFEVSNKLIERGHEVTVTAMSGDHKWFPAKMEVNYIKTPVILKWLEILSLYTKSKYGRPFLFSDVRHIVKFFTLNKITLDVTRYLANTIPDCDINVSTFCFTMPAVHMSGKGVIFHHVQGYDPWMFKRGTRERKIAEETFKLPVQRTVVSKWLQDLIFKKIKRTAIYVGNGVNRETFHSTEKKDRHVIMALIRSHGRKRSLDIIRILNNVVDKIPDVKLIAIGDQETLNSLTGIVKPKFEIELINPMDEKELFDVFSRSNVLLYTPEIEGFGLPPLEAMSSGVNVVTTDCLGTRDFCVNEYNALISKPGDIKDLTKSVIKILVDENLSERLRKNGIKTAKGWTWDKVANRMESAFKRALKEG